MPPVARQDRATADRLRFARRAVIVVVIIALAVIWTRLAVRPSDDLLNHQEFGRRFVAGEWLYANGLNYPYPPTWAAANAALAPLPRSIVSTAVFPIGVAALIVLLLILDRLSRDALPLPPRLAFWVTASALALTARFVIRDLLDGGPNLFLLSLAWCALYALWRGYAWTSAWLLGIAIALKLTAGIFVGVLMALDHRRQALRVLVCSLVLFVLPVARMGSTDYAVHMQHWVNRVSAGVLSNDPSVGVLGAEPDRNLSLRAALGRLVVTPASDAQLRRTAARVATALLVALTAGVLWVLRRRARGDPIDAAVAWAVGGVLALLVSPITWRAHAVALLPACYLLIRRWIAGPRLYAAGLVGLAAIAIPSVVLARGLVGEGASAWSDRWSITTAAFACLLVGAAAWPRR